jgi:glycosyltransferase involved in cell wall biosynthesis
MDIDPATITVIPAGLDMPSFLNIRPETWDLARSLGVQDLSPLLLAPVRITRRKNLELGLAVLAELVKLYPRAGFLVTGPTGAHNPENTAYLASLQEMRSQMGLEGRVHFLAEIQPAGISDRAIAEWYRLADALFLPSLEEGFGIPVLEAGLGRLPIFCTRLPALEALAGDMATYFDPQDPPASIAAQVRERLMNDQAFRLRDQIRGRFTWEAVYENHLKPLLEIQ